MRQLIALALKDLRLMPRNKGGMFFTFVWPILMTVLFGLAFGGDGNDGAQRKIGIAVVDEDITKSTKTFFQKCISTELLRDLRGVPRELRGFVSNILARCESRCRRLPSSSRSSSALERSIAWYKRYFR